MIHYKEVIKSLLNLINVKVDVELTPDLIEKNILIIRKLIEYHNKGTQDLIDKSADLIKVSYDWNPEDF